MGAFFQTALNQIKEFVKRQTRAQWIRNGLILAGIIAVAVVASVMLSRVNYAVLFPNMNTADAAEAYTVLTDGLGVQARTVSSGDGTTSVLVPADRVEDLRMRMAQEGFPKAGSDTSIFQQGTSLGSTQYVQDKYFVYQKEVKLESTFKTMSKVLDASVTLYVPDRSVFVLQSNTTRPTATVTLALKSGETLTQREVNGIALLISAAGENIALEDVAISDSNMNFYTVDTANANGDNPELLLDHAALTEQSRRSYEKQARMLLTPILGPEGELWSLSADVRLNFDDRAEQTKTVSPPVKDAGNSGIPISLREASEIIRDAGTAEGEPGMDVNGGAPVYPTTATETSYPYEKIEREVNYEVNEQRTMLEKAKGEVASLTISVAVNTQKYTAFTAEIQETLQSLLVNGLGITNSSYVSVYGLPFYVADGASREDYLAAYNEQEAAKRSADLRNTIIIALVILAAFILGMILLRRYLRPPVPVMPEDEGEIIDVGDEVPDLALVVPDEMLVKKNRDLERIEQLIDQDPEVAAQLLRSWLIDESR